MRDMSTASPLPNDIEALKRIIVERDLQAKQQYDALLSRMQQKDAEASSLALLIDKLKLQIAMLNRARYGASSEKLDTQIEQLELIVEELEAGQAETADVLVEKVPKIKPPAVRKPLPEHLPRETVLHEPVLACHCGCTDPARLTRLGEDVTEVLEKIPARLKVIRHVRPRYACRACEAVIQAPAPALPIERGRPGPGLMAHVLVSKYLDGLPL